MVGKMDREKASGELLLLQRQRHKSENDNQLFQDFVDNLSYDQIEKLIEGRAEFSEGLQVINAIFEGLTLRGTSQKKRVKLLEYLLGQVQEHELPARSVSSILTWLTFEVNKLCVTHLIRICDLCVDYISRTQVPQQACWPELLPKLLNILTQKEQVDHYGSEITGEQYKKQVVSAICQAKWNSSVLTPMTAMFIHITLTSEEHSKVVSKICSLIDSLNPEELPPLVHHLLQLTRSQNAVPVFFALKKYFNTRIYKMDDSSGMLDVNRTHGTTSSPSEESDEVQVSKKDLIESEAMILYHVEEASKRSLGCIVEIAKLSKSCIPCAETMVDPFFLAVLLIVSSHQTQVIDNIKNMFTRLVIEADKRNESDWMRQVLNTYCDVEGSLSKLIRSNASESEGVLKGLISLGLVLLKSPNKIVARYGRMIASNLVIKHDLVSGTLLDNISIQIISNPDIIQYSDCLDEVCDNSPLLVVEQPQVTNRLLESLPFLPEATASKVAYALISLVRVSCRLRDNLLMILRKSLFRNDVATRKLAVSGFLQLLKRMKIKGMYSLSQNTFQAYTCPSVFTQTLLDVHTQSNNLSQTNNEGICLEVIQVLRRCFSQQLVVKVAFYSGLHSALLKNPELCIPVVELFVGHLNVYFELEEDIIPPLNFGKAISIQSDDITIIEPLGDLVFAAQQIITTSDKRISSIVDDDYYQGNRLKLCRILDSLITRFTKMGIKNLDMDDDLDSSPEGKFKEERLSQCLTIYQALLAYLVEKLDVSTTDEDVKVLLGLFRAYSSLEEYAKNLKSKKDEDGRGRKPKGKKGVIPETVLDFETVIKLLSALLEESVDWCLNEVCDNLKNRAALYRFALETTAEIIVKSRAQLSIRKSKTILEHLTTLAKTLYRRLMCRFDDINKFDSTTVVLGVEVFSDICALLYDFYIRQAVSFLSDIMDCEGVTNIDQLLEKVLDPYLSILNYALDLEELDNETEHKRLLTALLSGLNHFSLHLPVDGLTIGKVYSWLMDRAQTISLSSAPHVKTLLNLLLTLLVRAKSETSLHDSIAIQLCQLFGPINDKELEKCTVKLAIINDSTKTVVYSLLVSALNLRLEAVNWVISRLKSELALIAQPDAFHTEPASRRGVLKRKEKDLVTELGLICSVAQSLCTCAVDLPSAELTCRFLQQLYTTLVAFTKYLMARGPEDYKEARYGKLVKLAAAHLSSQITEFLLYIESCDLGEDGETKKKLSVKALRQSKKQITYIPKLVAVLENFTKCVTQLGTKFKDTSLSANIKLITTRDFRLNTKKLQAALKRTHSSEDDLDSTVSTIASASVPSTSHQKHADSSQRPSTSSQKPSQKKGKKLVKSRKKRKTD